LVWAEVKSGDTLEQLTVTGQLSRYSATKSDTPILETARSISIETQQQMKEKGALSLANTFTYSAGIIGETYGYATRGDWLKSRGLDVPQYQDSLQSLFGNYNNTRPDIYTLEQVEILKGPASVLYGQGSPGGIVNVVSKRPQANARHEVAMELGTHDRKQVNVDSTGAIGESEQWLYRAVLVHRDSGTQVDHVEDQSTVFAPSLTWQPSEASRVSFLLNYTDTNSDTAAQFLPIAGTLESVSSGQEIESETYLGEPEFNRYDAETISFTVLADHQINERWSVELTTRYTDAESDYQQAWPAFIGGDRFVYNLDGSLYENGTVPRSFYRSDASSEQFALDVRLRADLSLGAWEHELLMGTQYQDVTTDSDGYYAYALGYAFAPGAPSTALGDRYWINVFNPVYGNVPPDDLLNALYSDNPSSTTEGLGIYLSDQLSLDNWRLTLGLRYDETETVTGTNVQSDEELSLSAGVLYQFENGISPYLSYAESFEPMVGDNGLGQALKPQTGEQLELGLKYQPSEFPGLLTLAYFEIEQSNLLDPSSLPGTGFEQQRGRAEIQGVELEAQATLNDLTLELNISKLHTESAEGMRLASVPDTQASSWISYRPGGPWAGFKTGVGFRYVGDSYGGADTLKTPSYTLADAMIAYELNGWEFSLNARNLGDKKYYSTCLSRGDCFPGERRTLVGRVAYQF